LRTILIGLGDIAQKHIEVMRKLDCEIIGVLGRDYEKTKTNAKKFEIKNVHKSFDDISKDDCDFFTILTNPENTGKLLKKIIPFKKAILVEKPVSLSSNDVEEIIELNKNYKTPIMVSMNRRFYSIFHKGLDYLKKSNKKINSIVIEAPERINDIRESTKFSDLVKKNWMFCNSIHCVDLIRFFGGDVEKIETNSDPNRLLYSAIGHCQNNIEFTYISNWKSPGSWSITLYADDVRITFNPLEKGVILKNNVKEEIEPSQEDIKFKPGFYDQLQYFLKNVVTENNDLWPASNLEDHKKSIKLVEEIFHVPNN